MKNEIIHYKITLVSAFNRNSFRKLENGENSNCRCISDYSSKYLTDINYLQIYLKSVEELIKMLYKNNFFFVYCMKVFVKLNSKQRLF